MRAHRWLAYGVILLLLAAPMAGAHAEPPAGDIREAPGRPEGRGFCFDRPLFFGNIVIAGARCYTFYLVRTSADTFLGLGPSGPPLVPPGQIVRLRTPAGEKVRGRLFYLIPLPGPYPGLALNTIQHVIVQVVGHPGRVVITLPRPGERPLELPFDQR